MNPFFVGRPIDRSEHFVGRGDLRRRICAHAHNLGSTSVIGERRTGKTSLLKQIERDIQSSPAHAGTIVVSLDCSTTVAPRSFCARLDEQLREIAGLPTASLRHDDGPDIELRIEQTLRQVSATRPVVIVLDEFDSVLENHAGFNQSFLERLRSFGQNLRVCFITATRRQLPIHFGSASPFFNIFMPQPVGLLTSQEAAQLLDAAARAGSAFSDSEKQWLQTLAGTHPYFLQLGAFQLFDLKQGTDSGQGTAEALERFLTGASQHFAYYWEKSDARERELLASICVPGAHVAEADRVAVVSLRERSLITKVGREWRPFCSAWARWVMNQCEGGAEPAGKCGSRRRRPRTSVRVLFIAANPAATDPLRLDKEMHTIQRRIEGKTIAKVEMIQEWAVQAHELAKLLLQHRPQIVHFSGHGSSCGGIILEDHEGSARKVSAATLAKLFSFVNDSVRCVVLNACWTATEAEALAQEVDCVIGMSRTITDRAAIIFAGGFYLAVAFGKSVRDAFKLAVAELEIEDLSEEQTPRIVEKRETERAI